MSRITKLFNLNDPGWGRGNNNGSEPPKRPKGNSDGPPDLDEVWRDFNNRIGSLFGRKGGGGGNRPGNRGGITPLSPHVAGAARVLQPEHGGVAWLPVPLQLVCQADLGQSLQPTQCT